MVLLKNDTTRKVYRDFQAAAEFLSAFNSNIVFTNGVFDILHAGHVAYLEAASNLGGALVVALNTDKSVRSLDKGDDRPINSENDRARLIAALECVACVILFDEPTPEKLISIVKPKIYCKGGDYKASDLPEATLVKKWSGKTIIMPFETGYSSTNIINKIRNKRKAAFLDRDGVINFDKGYLYRVEDFEYLPGAISGMIKLQNQGFEIVIVTNQSGIARGLYTEEQFKSLTQYIELDLSERGIKVLETYYCPHHPNGKLKQFAFDCSCRKPKPGMILNAAKRHGIDLNNSILIGDKERDLAAGVAAGIKKNYLVRHSSDKSCDTSIETIFETMVAGDL